jgi:stage II sporulation protein AB (anti-sigma F factor)
MIFPSLPQNEQLARTAVTSFIAQQNPEIGELAEIKTAVSEAVTNCIVHAYRGTVGDITLTCKCNDRGRIHIKITDKGCGIADITKAREPLWTSCPEEERAGLGFAVMENFSDKMMVKSAVGKGTVVSLMRQLTLHNESDEA